MRYKYNNIISTDKGYQLEGIIATNNPNRDRKIRKEPYILQTSIICPHTAAKATDLYFKYRCDVPNSFNEFHQTRSFNQVDDRLVDFKLIATDPATKVLLDKGFIYIGSPLDRPNGPPSQRQIIRDIIYQEYYSEKDKLLPLLKGTNHTVWDLADIANKNPDLRDLCKEIAKSPRLAKIVSRLPILLDDDYKPMTFD